MTDGSLGYEIERKSAEIREWPTWAQPFESDIVEIGCLPQPEGGERTGDERPMS
jgi:hypothetical protein